MGVKCWPLFVAINAIWMLLFALSFNETRTAGRACGVPVISLVTTWSKMYVKQSELLETVLYK